MKNLLYIGNKLSKHGNNTTSMETLGLLLEKEGFKVYYASSKKNKILRLFHMILKIIQYRKSVDYVLIDVYSTYNFWYAFIISLMCRFFNLKYIPNLHGGNLPQRLDKDPKLCKMIFNHAYVNIAPSNYLLSTFEMRGFSNILYIPNTIEIQKYPFKERKVIQPKLLWVRSFSEIYNPKMAVEVFYEVKKKYPTAQLCMVGPDSEGGLFKTQKLADDLGLEVFFSGKLTKPEWTNLSQGYDIMINTPHLDNMPVSVIEAMALGLVVVSTNVGGIPFLLKNNKEALLVNDNVVDEMVFGIQKLIENPDLFSELADNARLKAESFDWKIIKDEWLKILK
jgi:glycosyltransferase involved in cell wall biosynthesis